MATEPSAQSAEPSTGPSNGPSAGPSTDEQALELRCKGRSFAAIAKALGFARASQANEAFNRALRTRPKKDQTAIRDGENRRLDDLADRLRSRTDLSKDQVDNQIKIITRMREVLMAS